VADSANGLHVIHVADAAHPRRVASVGTSARGVALGHQRAYVASLEGLEIYDVADPRIPRPLGSLPLTAMSSGIALAENYCFVGGRLDGTSGLQVLDVSDPAQPRRVGGISIQSPARMVVSGSHLYVAATGSPVTLDISDPTQPRQVSAAALRATASDVALSGNHVYWAMGPVGVDVEDITDPAQPRVLGPFRTALQARALAASGDHLYVAGLQPLEVYFLDDPVRPSLAGSNTNFSQRINSLKLAAGKIFATGGAAGSFASAELFILSDPFVPMPPAIFGLQRAASGGFRLMLQGAAGRPFSVERSSDLLQWETWISGTLQEADATGLELLDDTEPEPPHRFYRARQP